MHLNYSIGTRKTKTSFKKTTKNLKNVANCTVIRMCPSLNPKVKYSIPLSFKRNVIERYKKSGSSELKGRVAKLQ